MKQSNFNWILQHLYKKTLLDEDRFIRLFISLFYNGTELMYTLTTLWNFATH